MGRTIIMKRQNKGLTLLELIIAVILLGIVVLAVTNIDYFAHFHVITADRRVRLQNELSLVLEHMSKKVSQSIGEQDQISHYPIQGTTSGFIVRTDPNNTPQNLDDDLLFTYALSTNTLTSTCSQVSADSPACPTPASETLTTHLMSDVASGTKLPSNPATPKGLYYFIDDNNTTIEVGLIGRHDVSKAKSLDNPQVEMSAGMRSRAASAVR